MRPELCAECKLYSGCREDENPLCSCVCHIRQRAYDAGRSDATPPTGALEPGGEARARELLRELSDALFTKDNAKTGDAFASGCLATDRALKAARAFLSTQPSATPVRTAEQERADVVAWLSARVKGHAWESAVHASAELENVCDEIERGEHVGAAERGK